MKGTRTEISSGDRFGRLVVVKETGSLNGYRYIECVCDCGNVINTKLTFLIIGTAKSCGCIKRENVGNIKHGGSRKKLYNVWVSMRQRCNNHKNKNFNHYGGRGILICNDWSEFSKFESWAKNNGYKEGLTLDRIDNNGNYSPENCRWVPMSVQCLNTRYNRVIEFDGKSQTLHEWALDLGIKDCSLNKRLKKWPHEMALTKIK